MGHYQQWAARPRLPPGQCDQVVEGQPDLVCGVVRLEDDPEDAVCDAQYQVGITLFDGGETWIVITDTFNDPTADGTVSTTGAMTSVAVNTPGDMYSDITNFPVTAVSPSTGWGAFVDITI